MPRFRSLLSSVALAAALAAVPVAAASADTPDLRRPIAEIAALYGVPASTATAVETLAARRPAGLRHVALPSRRRVVVVALDGPPARVLLPDRRHVGVVEALLDPGTGRVLAAAVERRRPALGELGTVRRLRLPELGAEAPPPVTGLGFDSALENLRAAGYRVAATHFPRFPESPYVGPSGLAFPGVAAALPIGSRTVRLELAPRLGPSGSPAIPSDHPDVRVPDFRGLSYAVARLGSPGLYVRLGSVGPLRPASSVLGLDAFVVTAQRPAAGSMVPAYGVPIPNGVDLGPSVVTLTLGVRGPGAGRSPRPQGVRGRE